MTFELEKKIPKPEKLIPFGEELTMEEIYDRFSGKNNEENIVSLWFRDWDDTKRALVADLADGIVAYVPESEICVEKLKYVDERDIPLQALSLIHKTAYASIIDIQDNVVTLSRKELQKNVLNELVIGETYDVCIKSITSLGVFVDIGAGITGFIANSEIAITPFNSPEDIVETYGFFKGKKIQAKLLAIKSGKTKLSFRRSLNFPHLVKGDATSGIVRNRLSDNSGYFVDISPNDTAIVDVPFELNYGERILVEIKASTSICEEDDYIVKHHAKFRIRLNNN